MLNVVQLKAQGRIKSPTIVDLFLYDDGIDNPMLDPFIVSVQQNVCIKEIRLILN